jgi:BioD-like phosphotransacetylase family protein
MCKRIFIAATQQNDGKTTVSLGLMAAFRKRFKRISFIKPVGQRYVVEQGYKVEEDSVLIERIFGIDCSLKDTSPVAIEKGFTEWYIRKGKPRPIGEQIKESYRRVARNKGLVVIEGTGHAGVGSCFDWCNSRVAKLLRSKVILVTSGGIGRPIDEIMLNKALFDKEGVELIGVIVNKVIPEKYDKINKFVRMGFERKKINVLGVLPYKPFLSAPTVKQICEELETQIVIGKSNSSNIIEHIVIGAMEPHEALKHIKEKCLIITSGDREDIILAALSSQLCNIVAKSTISGFVLTGGLRPHSSIIELVKSTNIPVMFVSDDTYTTAKKIHDRTIKIQPEDKEKINIVSQMLEKYVDVDKILKKI